jgi:hypothetical protein
MSGQTTKIYFSTTDPEGREIRLHEDTWMNHIKQKHPEIKNPTEIKTTIQRPDFITENTARNSLAYSKISRLDLHLNVYVRVDDNTCTAGRVSTVFLQKDAPRGDVIWYRKS